MLRHLPAKAEDSYRNPQKQRHSVTQRNADFVWRQIFVVEDSAEQTYSFSKEKYQL